MLSTCGLGEMFLVHAAECMLAHGDLQVGQVAILVRHESPYTWHMQATTEAQAQRATSEGQKETDGLGGGTVAQVSASPDGLSLIHI